MRSKCRNLSAVWIDLDLHSIHAGKGEVEEDNPPPKPR